VVISPWKIEAVSTIAVALHGNQYDDTFQIFQQHGNFLANSGKKLAM